MANLIEQLIVTSEAMAAMRQNSNLRYSCIHEFVLKFGVPFRYEAPPKQFRWGMPKQCFANSAKLASLKKLVYVEGFGIVKEVGLAIHHAWCCEPGSNVVIDITTTNIDPYFGVPFTHATLRRHWKTSDSASIIDDWKSGWPLLTMEESAVQQMIANVPPICSDEAPITQSSKQ